MVVPILKISLKFKNKVNYVILVLILYNTFKFIFLWLKTCLSVTLPSTDFFSLNFRFFQDSYLKNIKEIIKFIWNIFEISNERLLLKTPFVLDCGAFERNKETYGKKFSKHTIQSVQFSPVYYLSSERIHLPTFVNIVYEFCTIFM